MHRSAVWIRPIQRPFLVSSFKPRLLLRSFCSSLNTYTNRVPFSFRYPMTGPSEPLSQSSKVLVLGSGNFGSCLASHLGDSQHDVYMWARDESIVTHFNKHHRNPVYLRDHQFPTNITAVGPGLPDKNFTDSMDVLLFAIPTQFLRYFLFDLSILNS